MDVDWPAVLVDRLTTTHLDVLCELLATFVHTLMGAEADALCGAGYGERKRRAHRLPQRVPAPSIRHPHRVSGSRDPDATPRFLRRGLAAGTPHTCRADPEHGRGDLLPATCSGCPPGGWTNSSKPWGVTSLFASLVSVMAENLDATVEAFRTRPVDAGPYTFVAADTPGAQGPRTGMGGRRARADRGRGQCGGSS